MLHMLYVNVDYIFRTEVSPLSVFPYTRDRLAVQSSPHDGIPPLEVLCKVPEVPKSPLEERPYQVHQKQSPTS